MNIDKIPIAGTPHDRRAKLSEKQKTKIRQQFADKQQNISQLAKTFNVSRRTIYHVVMPETAIADNKRAAAWRKAHPASASSYAKYMRNLRSRKKQIYTEKNKEKPTKTK